VSAIADALRALWELFVEDATFTLAIVICLAVAYVLSVTGGVAPTWRGGILFLLLAFALVENVWRSARR
jgi:hypothetical protein